MPCPTCKSPEPSKHPLDGDYDDLVIKCPDPFHDLDLVSFTVPKSGRRITIHVEDWIAIQAHMEIALIVRRKMGN